MGNKGKAKRRKTSKSSPVPDLLLFPFKNNELLSEEGWESIGLETLRDLKAENDKEKDNIHPLTATLTFNVGFELIWGAVEEFDLSSHCKFIAVDLLHRFLVKQIDTLAEYASKSTETSHKREKVVRELKDRLTSQSPLRALSCVMIASKLDCHRKKVDAKMIHSFSQKLEMKFSVKQILKSEIRILEQLEHRVSSTKSFLVYVGALVHSVDLAELREAEKVEAEDLYVASEHLLDIALLSYDKLYMELFFFITGSRVVSENLRPAYARVIADRFLLAASTVVGAGWILEGDSLCSALVSRIHHLTHLSVDDLESVAACLLDVAGLNISNPKK